LDTDQAFVEHIYLNTLIKTVADDPDGIKFWVDKISVEGNSRAFVVTELIKASNDSANAGAAQDQFQNRVEVSDYTADTVTKAPTDYKTSTSFVTASNPNGGLTVSDDATTVTSAKDTVDTLPTGETGNVDILTNGMDTLTGTDNDDIYYAIIDEKTASNNTLQSFDSINAGKGSDTLSMTLVDSAAAAGERAFGEGGCGGCHVIGKVSSGPDLTGVLERHGEDSEKWVREFILNPEEMYKDPYVNSMIDYFKLKMPNQHMSKEEVKDIIQYLKWVDENANLF